ncbi:MAG: zinc ribbon domain-containing protein [Lachnospiraceae bacterium]|nr:zinc ribbon domain-containing protein [Lachnospiraceae bacterium]
MQCKNCGNEISENDAFCPSCGTATAETTEATVEATAEAVTEATTEAAPNPFAAQPTAPTTPDPSNPFAAGQEPQVEAPAKRNKTGVLVAAVLGAIVLLCGLGFGYQKIIIPKQERASIMSYTDSAMYAITSDDTEDDTSMLFDTDLKLDEDDIQEAVDEMMAEVEAQYGITPSDSFRASVEGMFRAIADRMVESYTIDEESYTVTDKTKTVDVNVTGLDLMALESSMEEEDIDALSEAFFTENLDRFMAMESEDEMASCMVNEFLPQVFDLYTDTINNAPTTDSVWTFTYEGSGNDLTLKEVDTHGTLSEDAITDIF